MHSTSLGPRGLACCLLLCLALPALVLPAAASDASRSAWIVLEPGLELGEFPADLRGEPEGAAVHVLRIDPGRYALRLLNASAPGQGRAYSAREWSEREGLVAAVNASMYAEDLRHSVSLMKTRTHTNNARLSRDMALLAFDPLDPGVPEVQIIDRECQDLDALRPRYGTLVQSVRMVSCAGANVWRPQPRRASLAAIGVDAEGRVLFLHSSLPRSTHDQVEWLLRLPIDLKRCMYTEGGSEAQLFVQAGGRAYEFSGDAHAGFALVDEPRSAPAIPNVIGVARRADARGRPAGK